MPRIAKETAIVSLLFVLYTVNGVDRVCLSIAMPLLAGHYHFSPMQEGILFSSFFWTYCLFQVPSGLLLDRVLPSVVIVAAVACWGIAAALSGAAVGFGTLLATRLMLGLFEAPFMPAANLIVEKAAGGSARQGKITIIDSGAAFGAALGSYAASAIVAATGSWRLAFLITGGAAVCLAPVAWRRLVARGTTGRPRAPSSDGWTGPPGVRGVLTRDILYMCLGRIAFANVFFGFASWAPSLLIARRHVSLEIAGTITALMFVAAGAGEIVGGAVFGRLRRHVGFDSALRLTIGLSGSVGLAALVAANAIGNLAACAATLVVGLFFYMFGGIYWVIPAAIAPEGRLGLVGGILNFSGTFGGIAVGIVSGWIVKNWGYGALYGYFLACMALYILFSMCLRPHGRASGVSARDDGPGLAVASGVPD
ncbi:MFS transporter [Gluconacetobacter azotocaptans]|uniref:MFS transporter n=1 Tax=Gluconacetobacter azotocaptans TaxID=142834 RepID=A0A7W4JQR0_9PROT|nr:MFS transporter [Gluconacetobacter azotocaptans]MBB2189037.1 MFS transporter [Gluconacetobacter azotocaptans]GBQ26953.1 sugar phosphate permease [Gluconacetobacter azotocaptans DSM 13594]